MSPIHIRRVKFFVSTKADILTSKVNAWLDVMKDEYGDDFSVDPNIQPVMSYTTIKDKGAYMIGCCVNYRLFCEEHTINYRYKGGTGNED